MLADTANIGLEKAGLKAFAVRKILAAAVLAGGALGGMVFWSVAARPNKPLELTR